MSRLREYRFDPVSGTMKPAWSEKNEEWGAATLELMRERRKREGKAA